MLLQENLFAQISFITNWETSATDEVLTIPTVTGEIYNYTIDWGDGSAVETITSGVSPTHQYAIADIYSIEITGEFPRIFFNNSGNRLNILSIEQWGEIQWSSLEGAFTGCENLVLNATDTPILTNVTSMANAFRQASSFVDEGGSIGNWDVSNVTDMTALFFGASSFNSELNNWSVFNVKNMQFMFNDATLFNGNISGWDVSNVTNMSSMFEGGQAFNQDIGNWNVGNVTEIGGMFNGAIAFNADISNWNVGSVTNMNAMFSGASIFNQEIGSWDVSLVENMGGMFINATAFNQDLGEWNVGNVIDMTDIMPGTAMSTDNYDATLIGWSALPDLSRNVTLDLGITNFCNSQAARNNLIANNNWIINDGGLNCISSALPAENHAVVFDQFGNNIITFEDAPAFTETLTLEAWVRVDEFTGSNSTIASWEFPNGSYVFFGLLDNHLAMRLASFDGSAFTVEEVVDPSPFISGFNTGLTHVAVTGNSTSGYQLFVNGDLMIDGTINDLALGTGGIFSIGARFNTDPNISVVIADQFGGTIDNIKIYDSQRSAHQINQDLYRDFTINDVDLVGGYNFNEGSGVILSDFRSSKRNGVLLDFIGNPWVESNAVEFPATEDVVTLDIGNNPTTSGGLTIASNAGFPSEAEDFITFGHNGGSNMNFIDDAFVSTDLINARLERLYFLQTFNEGQGGTVDLTFTSRDSDNENTYYLLKRNEVGIFEIATYTNVDVSGNTYQFTVPIDSLSNGYYTMGRGFGSPGNALSFVAQDGVDDYVFVENGPVISPDMTVETWVNIPGGAINPRTICSFGGYTVDDRYFRMNITASNTVSLTYNAGAGVAPISQTTTEAIVPDRWTHVAFTKTGDDFSVYLDGVLALDNVPLVIDPGATTFFLGATDNTAASPTIDALDGILDEFRIWDDVRSQQELEDNLFNTIVSSETNLQAYYRFDQPSNSRNFLPDYSGNNRFGNLVNFAFNFENSDWVLSEALSSTQNTLLFDGVDDRVVSDSPITISGDHTIELWVQNNATGLQRQVLFGLDNSASGVSSIQGYLESGLFSIALRDGSGASTRVIQANETDFSDMAWHHIVYTLDATNSVINIYIDGIEQTLTELENVGSFTDFTLNAPLVLGMGDPATAITSSSPFNGKIDEFRIWDSLVDLVDIRNYIITEDLDSPLHPNRTDLILYYTFNEGIEGGNNAMITALPDLSGNNRTATLNDFALVGLTSNFVFSEAFEQSGNITLLGNGIEVISLGVPVIENGTSFGSSLIDNGSISRQFEVVNNGTGDLFNILFALSPDGVNRGLFTAELDQESLAPFESALLTITYSPTESGTTTGSFLISSDDADLFTFLIEASTYEDLAGPGNAMRIQTGINQFDLGQNYDFEIDSAFSIEAWINHSRPFGLSDFTAPIISKRSAIGDGTGYSLSLVDGILTFQLIANVNNLITVRSTDVIPENSWQHVAMVYDGSNLGTNVNLYLNGELLTTTNVGVIPLPNTIRNTEPAYIGFDALTIDNFNGRIDEVRIHGAELTPLEINANLHRTIDPQTINLIGYYRADVEDGFSLPNLVGEAGNAVFTSVSINPFAISNAPINNAVEFLALSDRAALWNGKNIGFSANLTLEDIDFVNDDDDRLFLANDNSTASSDDFVRDRLESLSPLVYSRLSRNWFIGIVDSTESQTGGELLLSFEEQSPNPSRTYYLLTANDNVESFQLADYRGYELNDNTITFNVSAESLDPSAFYTLARSETFPGNALLFDGNDDFVTVNEMGNTENFTYELWVRPDQLNTTQTIYDLNDESGASINLSLTTTNQFNFTISNAAGSTGVLTSSNPVNLGEWVHVAVTGNGTVINLYINGVFDQAASFVNGAFLSGAFTFGANVAGLFNFEGAIDEFRLWGDFRTEGEINEAFRNVATRGDASLPFGLIVNYRFDQIGDSRTLPDIAGSGQVLAGRLQNFNFNTNSGWIASQAFLPPPNTVVSLADSGPGSLREVINQANLTPTIDTIRFDLDGQGPWVITLDTELTVTDSLVIAADSQPNWNFENGMVVEIEGAVNNVEVGINVLADYFELYGMKVNGFQAFGVNIENNLASGCMIGDEGRGNIFINNTAAGLRLSGADNGFVRGNFIGSDFDGAEGPNDVGIVIGEESLNNLIGGSATNMSNVIVFNNVGIQVNGSTSFGNEIRQNQISCNILSGIRLNDGGNGGIPAPLITGITSTSLSGTGIDTQEIDVYLATDSCNNDQGVQYIASGVVTDGVWLIEELSLKPGDFYIATATTIAEGTSEFSRSIDLVFEQDVAALERIFNDLNGDGWEPAVNWSDPGVSVSNWDGITTLEGRVVGIDLSDFNLTGELPAFIGEELIELDSLKLNDNNISKIPDLTKLTQLVSLQAQNNFLDFGSIEPNLLITDFQFTPQNALLDEVIQRENEGIDVQLDRTIDGSTNVYTWTKDGNEIPTETAGILNLTNVTFEDEGEYLAMVVNDRVPGLTLTTNPITLRVSSLERDSISLRALYDQMGGSNWSRGQNWLVDPISAWEGVTISGNRVTELDLNTNGLTGTLPIAVLDILNLEVLNLSANEIDSIPSLESLELLNSVNIEDNHIEFDDLEANVNLGNRLTIGSQTLGIERINTEVNAGEPFTVSVDVGGLNNEYQWSLDGNEIMGANSPVYEISAVNRTSQGLYECSITNTIVTDLEITSSGDNLIGIADVLGTAFIAGSGGEFLTEGSVRLLAVRENAYDTIGGVLPLSTDGSYSFINVPLQDYILSVDPEDRLEFLPTYHVQAIQWDFATKLALNSDTTLIDVQVERVPTDIEQGVGVLTGEIFTDFPDDGRIEARRRVRRVGCALRRRRSQGRPGEGRPGLDGGRVEMDTDGFELYSYQTSDENGEFVFNNLPEGTYRLFIEYPGIPIREDSFTEFEIGSNENEDNIEVVVTVFEDGIEILEQAVVNVGADFGMQDFELYPNPAKDELFINSNISGNFYVEIIDLKGVVLLTKDFQENAVAEPKNLDISGIDSGIYLLRVTSTSQNNKRSETRKLIIEK